MPACPGQQSALTNRLGRRVQGAFITSLAGGASAAAARPDKASSAHGSVRDFNAEGCSGLLVEQPDFAAVHADQFGCDGEA